MLIDADWAMVVTQESDNKEWHQIMSERTQIQKKKKKCPLDVLDAIFTFDAWASGH